MGAASRGHRKRGVVAMAIDPTTETLRPFAEAARRLPRLRSGRPVSPATLWRWASRGVRARDGQPVRLETIKIGGTTCTSLEALARFFARLSGEGEEGTVTPIKRQSQTETTLDAAGI